MTVNPKDINIGDVATIMMVGMDIIYADDEEYWKERDPFCLLDLTIIGLAYDKESNRNDLTIFASTDKIDDFYHTAIPLITLERVESIKKNMINYSDYRQYEWKDNIDNYLNQYGRWINVDKLISVKKTKIDPVNDSCKCRICRNFIYMAAPDNQNDGMMTCNSCISNPIRAYY